MTQARYTPKTAPEIMAEEMPQRGTLDGINGVELYDVGDFIVTTSDGQRQVVRRGHFLAQYELAPGEAERMAMEAMSVEQLDAATAPADTTEDAAAQGDDTTAGGIEDGDND